MQYRTIGKTGLRVSEIGFGCGNNAVLMVKAPHQDQVKAVRHALDWGSIFSIPHLPTVWESLKRILAGFCTSSALSRLSQRKYVLRPTRSLTSGPRPFARWKLDYPDSVEIESTLFNSIRG